MYRVGFIILFITVFSWIVVGTLGDDWRIATYTAFAVFIFSAVLFYRAFKNRVRARRVQAPIPNEPGPSEVSRALGVKVKELEALKAEFVSGVSREIAAPLAELQTSAKLLLEGAYGKLSPSAEEAVEQITKRAGEAQKAARTFIETHPASPATPEPAKPSIKNLKVN